MILSPQSMILGVIMHIKRQRLGQPGLDSRLLASLLAFSPLLGLPVCPPHLASRGKALQSTKVKDTDQLGDS